jgi:hypothetical protein
MLFNSETFIPYSPLRCTDSRFWLSRRPGLKRLNHIDQAARTINEKLALVADRALNKRNRCQNLGLLFDILKYWVIRPNVTMDQS